MISEKMRDFELLGKRRGIRLDVGTWQAIDWLAAKQCKKWHELATEWAKFEASEPHADENLTRVIRSSAISAVLDYAIIDARSDSLLNAGPLGQQLGECDSNDISYAINQAEQIERTDDFGGFTLSCGVSEFGKVTFYIKGNLSTGSNCIINTPFTLDQWTSQVEQ